MEDDHDTLICSRLKDPWKFLMVDMDVAMVCMPMGFLLMNMGAHIFIVIGIPFAVGYLWHKWRDGKPKGAGAHWRYWYLPKFGPINRLKATPDSHCHRTIG